MLNQSNRRMALALLIVPIVALGCNDTTQDPQDPDPPTEGEELWSFVEGEDYRANWDLWPGRGELYEGQEPHGMLLTTYLNSLAMDALAGSPDDGMPSGAIIVKENYMPGGELAAITTMHKVDGYNPEAGDWFWLRTDPDGMVEMEGRVDGCISCHLGAADFDHVWLWHQDAAGLPGPDGGELWAFLEEENFRENWELWPNRGELYEGQEPHGMLLTTYLNDRALRALEDSAHEMPPGAIIIKENYMPGGELAATTTMYKVTGYNPEAGDWFWLRTDPDGMVEMEGQVDGCISCHTGAADFDHVWLWHQDGR
jgi:hypothetical protein